MSTNAKPKKKQGQKLECPNCGNTEDFAWSGYHHASTSIFDVRVDETGEVKFEWSGYMRYADEHTGLAQIKCADCECLLATESIERLPDSEHLVEQMRIVESSDDAERWLNFRRLAANPTDADLHKTVFEHLHRAGFDDLQSAQYALAFALIGSAVFSFDRADKRRAALLEFALSLTDFD